jgi:hypothetical protein
MSLLSAAGPPPTVTLQTVRSRSVAAYERLDAHFFVSPGVAAAERIALIEAAGLPVKRLADLARVWDPSRFTRAWATPSEPGVPYLRPYDVFDILPAAAGRLSVQRTDGLERLRLQPGMILQTCSGRNLGPCAYVDQHLGQFALSHDMIRLQVQDEDLRYFLLTFLQTPIGQALLRRGKSGSVIDHLTVADVAAIPVPLLDEPERGRIAALARQAMAHVANARAGLTEALRQATATLPGPSAPAMGVRSWTVTSSNVGDRLDVAHHDPVVVAARQAARTAGGSRCRELATAHLPVRYKRVYVQGEHGRPILSGRQLLQVHPVNLRRASDRSFKVPADYELAPGMTIFGAVGRAEGRQGAPALVTEDRAGWLASNDVMRLRPRTGVDPVALWLAVATPYAQVQIKALSFGSVVDHMNPWDVEDIWLPPVPARAVATARQAWAALVQGRKGNEEAVARLEDLLGRAGHGAPA